MRPLNQSRRRFIKGIIASGTVASIAHLLYELLSKSRSKSS